MLIEQVHAQIALRDISQHAWYKTPVSKCLPVRSHTLGHAIEVAACFTAHLLIRGLLQVFWRDRQGGSLPLKSRRVDLQLPFLTIGW